MVINELVVVYVLFLVCSLCLGLLGCGAGLAAIPRYRFASTQEKRFVFEKKIYLSSSAIYLGAVLRVIMVPLWFAMLQSLVPVIPGAMCLSGVHQNVPVYSWLASAMKLVLPLLYFSWIILTLIDRKTITHPFLNHRFVLSMPLGFFIIAEAILDLKFIASVRTVFVTCCTAIFDYNSGNIPQVLTENHWYFVIAFLAVFAVQVILLLSPGSKMLFAAISFNSMILFILLLLALHTKLSPLILEAPFHHCVFCLLQGNAFVLFGSFLLLVGIYLSFPYGLVGFAGINRKLSAPQVSLFGRVKLLTLGALGIGFMLLFIPVVYYL